MIKMVGKTTKKELTEVVKIVRLYGNRMLDGLTEKEVSWIAENTKGTPIISQLRHLLNSEAYWMKMIKDDAFSYVSRKTDFKEMVEIFNSNESKILELIEEAGEEELSLRLPEWEGERYQNLKRRGTLAWKIYRGSIMHMIHHFGQIAYIRFSLENPPADKIEGHPDPWGYVMDKLIFLTHFDE
jgi:hypothetical protein